MFTPQQPHNIYTSPQSVISLSRPNPAKLEETKEYYRLIGIPTIWLPELEKIATEGISNVNGDFFIKKIPFTDRDSSYTEPRRSNMWLGLYGLVQLFNGDSNFLPSNGDPVRLASNLFRLHNGPPPSSSISSNEEDEDRELSAQIVSSIVIKPKLKQRVDITYKGITKQYQVIYLQPNEQEVIEKFVVVDDKLNPTLVLIYDMRWFAKFENVNLDDEQQFKFY